MHHVVEGIFGLIEWTRHLLMVAFDIHAHLKFACNYIHYDILNIHISIQKTKKKRKNKQSRRKLCV